MRDVLTAMGLGARESSTAGGRGRERYRRVILAVTSGIAARALGTFISLVTVPLLLAYLGKEQFGLWSAITATVAWLSVCDLGLGVALVNVVAEAHGRDDHEGAARAVTTTLAVLLLVAAVLAVVFAVVVPRISWDRVFGAEGVVAGRIVRMSVAAAVGGFLLGLPLSVAPSVYAGYQKAYVANGFAAAGAAASLGAVAAGIWLRVGLPALILMVAAAGALVSFANLLFLTAREMAWLRIRLSQLSTAAWRRLSRSSTPILLFQAGALMVNQSQLFILSHTSDLGTVADYALLVRIIQAFGSMVVLTTAAFFPPYREAVERGDHDWVHAAFRRVLQLRVGLAAAAALTLTVAGNALIAVWLQRHDIRFPLQVWAALGIYLLAGAWVAAHTDLLTILDRIWIQVALVMVNGLVTVLLTVWLSPVFGVLGVLLAASGVTVLMYTWLLPLLTRAVLHDLAPQHVPTAR